MSDTITITGNIATDPEIKRTPTGVTITSFRVASAQRRFDRSTNTWVDTGTNWYNVSTFRALAEHAFQSLRRGDRVVLTGRLRIRRWDTGAKQGTSVDIDADAIGHDLLFGTSKFEKGSRSTSGGVPASDDGGSWDTGSPSSDPTGVAGDWGALPSDDARELVLAGTEAPF